MRKTLASIAMLIALSSCQSARAQVEGDGLIVLEGATLNDGTGSDSKPDSVVVLQGARILRVGHVGAFAYPPEARVINVSGKWIVPGFVDTRAHMPEPEDQAAVLKSLVAFGITSMRNPGPVTFPLELQSRIVRGEVVSPRLVTAGNLIDAPGGNFSGVPEVTEVRSEQEVRAEVQRQVADGVDLSKLYRGLPPVLVQAAIDEAHRSGRPVIGHLGNDPEYPQHRERVSSRGAVPTLGPPGPSVAGQVCRVAGQ